jgi:hypothetical protein
LSSPLDPVWAPRIDPVTASPRVNRRRDKKDEQEGRKHSDEPTPDEEEPEDGGPHIDVLA